MNCPLKKEESYRELFMEKKLTKLCKKDSELQFSRFIDILLKSTRFNDISDFMRTFYQNSRLYTIFYEIFGESTHLQNFIFHYPIIISYNYFLENFLHKHSCIEKYFVIQKSLNSFLLNKKKFKSNKLFVKKLSAKYIGLKLNTIFVTIMNHENLMTQKIIYEAENYSEWFCLSLEKYLAYNYYRGKINFSLGKIALLENKKIKAFSLFIQAIEELGKNNFKDRLIIAEWIVFSSIFLKKINLNKKFWAQLISFRSKNLLKIKAINDSLERNNMILLEKIIFKSNKHSIVAHSFYVFAKKFFKRIKKKIKALLTIFIRIPMDQFSIKLGVSRKKTELSLSYYTLKGIYNGYLDSINDVYTVSFKTKMNLKSKIFMDASVNLGSLINFNLEKKNSIF